MIIGFDLEITNELEKFEHWKLHRPLTVSCVGFFTAFSKDVVGEGSGYALWSTQVKNGVAAPLKNLEEVVETLDTFDKSGCTIVTWNGLAFDFPVIADAVPSLDFSILKRIALGPNHVDLMFNVFMQLGYFVGLGTTAKETIGEGKQGLTGAAAPKAWNSGLHEDVITYCIQDAAITAKLYRHLIDQPLLKWRTKSGYGQPRQMRKTALTLSVAATLANVEPPEVPRWMTSSPPTLKSFLEYWHE